MSTATHRRYLSIAEFVLQGKPFSASYFEETILKKHIGTEVQAISTQKLACRFPVWDF